MYSTLTADENYLCSMYIELKVEPFLNSSQSQDVGKPEIKSDQVNQSMALVISLGFHQRLFKVQTKILSSLLFPGMWERSVYLFWQKQS